MFAVDAEFETLLVLGEGVGEFILPEEDGGDAFVGEGDLGTILEFFRGIEHAAERGERSGVIAAIALGARDESEAQKRFPSIAVGLVVSEGGLGFYDGLLAVTHFVVEAGKRKLAVGDEQAGAILAGEVEGFAVALLRLGEILLAPERVAEADQTTNGHGFEAIGARGLESLVGVTLSRGGVAGEVRVAPEAERGVDFLWRLSASLAVSRALLKRAAAAPS